MKSATQLTLNLTSAASVVAIPQPGGGLLLKPGKILVEGSVADAAKALGLDRKMIYALIEDGEITAWKPRKCASNCHWRIEMASVYEYRSRRRQEYLI